MRKKIFSFFSLLFSATSHGHWNRWTRVCIASASQLTVTYVTVSSTFDSEVIGRYCHLCLQSVSCGFRKVYLVKISSPPRCPRFSFFLFQLSLLHWCGKPLTSLDSLFLSHLCFPYWYLFSLLASVKEKQDGTGTKNFFVVIASYLSAAATTVSCVTVNSKLREGCIVT